VKPRDGYVKLNVDVAFSMESFSREVICDDHGTFIARRSTGIPRRSCSYGRSQGVE
jgi:hypothetical protein